MTAPRPRVLVVGAREGSLGMAVADVAVSSGYDPYIAGISGESVPIDVLTDPMPALKNVVASIHPSHVVCTVGLNMPQPQEPDLMDWYRWHFETNVIGPMRLLEAFTDAAVLASYHRLSAEPCHYVAISSNSARIPRSRSAAYCASKAALSMALRVKGREGMGGDNGYIVYGYEPGLLAGTPMTEDTKRRFPDVPLTRMRGGKVSEGLDVQRFAEFIVGNLRGGAGLNGTLIPYDAGEL